MAEGTRFSKLEDSIHKLREASERQHQTSGRQQQLLTEIIHKIAATEGKYEQIFRDLRQEQEETLGHATRNRAEGGVEVTTGGI